MSVRRRALLAGAALAPLVSCGGQPSSAYAGGWVGANAQRGHMLRERKSGNLPAPAVQRRAGAIVVGGGISGLAAARELRRAGIEDVQVFDLEDEAGGNSRGHAIAGMRCPLGAHYLPAPGEHAVEVIALLEELGLRRTEGGVPVYDERTLCFSPQERLYIDGFWHDGLLPPVDALPAAERTRTLEDYRRFAREVERVGANGAFSIPTARSAWTPALAALDSVSFAHWLDQQGLASPALRWYLDYCCRDDYGAGAAQVSAWGGLHYFASRHGFSAPGEGPQERDNLLTWPEGNAWLARKLAQPLRERLRTGRVVLRVAQGRDTVTVDAWDDASRQVERWIAPQVVLAVPLFIAARLLEAPPAALLSAANALPHAPWLVANLHLAEALEEHPGAPLSWDNVIYDAAQPNPTLGYVDAMHQSLRSIPGATVLTFYWALGGQSPAQLAMQRARLLGESWQDWSGEVVRSLAGAHPDLPAKLRRVDLMRYGHAMGIPAPGVRGSAALQALANSTGRVHFAHTDLSAYSVFEEALFLGTRAGGAAAAELKARSVRSSSI